MKFYSSARTGEVHVEKELDLTNSHLHDLAEVEIRPTLEVCASLLRHTASDDLGVPKLPAH
jgi:hypothetical protein